MRRLLSWKNRMRRLCLIDYVKDSVKSWSLDFNSSIKRIKKPQVFFTIFRWTSSRKIREPMCRLSQAGVYGRIRGGRCRDTLAGVILGKGFSNSFSKICENLSEILTYVCVCRYIRRYVLAGVGTYTYTPAHALAHTYAHTRRYAHSQARMCRHTLADAGRLAYVCGFRE
jgi:hypothetical protein